MQRSLSLRFAASRPLSQHNPAAAAGRGRGARPYAVRRRQPDVDGAGRLGDVHGCDPRIRNAVTEYMRKHMDLI